MISEVVNTIDQFEISLKQGFENNSIFSSAMKTLFYEFKILKITNCHVPASQYLPLYIDRLLEIHASKLTENEMNIKIDKVMKMFKYLSEKDIFMDSYIHHFSLRMLSNNKRISDYYERSIISKLKSECGFQYTTKLEAMWNDIIISQWENTKYQTYCEKMRLMNDHNNNDSDSKSNNNYIDTYPIELETQVLTQGIWPLGFTSSKNDCKLPIMVENEKKKFHDFYCNMYNYRKLVFDTSRGIANLRVEFDKGSKQLVCTTYQMCILMLFNNCNILTWKDIKTKLEIHENNVNVVQNLMANILGLAHPKIKILLKKPKCQELKDDDKFKLNIKYTNERYRIRVPVLELNSNKSKNQERMTTKVPRRVEEMRKNRVEASIMRIMKARKRLDHNNLVTQVSKQLSDWFTPQPKFIKKRIESLIERDYLTRDKVNRRVYNYVA